MPIRAPAGRRTDAAACKVVAVAASGDCFILYGSAARCEMREDSGVDLLLDMPGTSLRRAYDVAESTGRAGVARRPDPPPGNGR